MRTADGAHFHEARIAVSHQSNAVIVGACHQTGQFVWAGPITIEPTDGLIYLFDYLTVELPRKIEVCLAESFPFAFPNGNEQSDSSSVGEK